MAIESLERLAEYARLVADEQASFEHALAEKRAAERKLANMLVENREQAAAFVKRMIESVKPALKAITARKEELEIGPAFLLDSHFGGYNGARGRMRVYIDTTGQLWLRADSCNGCSRINPEALLDDPTRIFAIAHRIEEALVGHLDGNKAHRIEEIEAETETVNAWTKLVQEGALR